MIGINMHTAHRGGTSLYVRNPNTIPTHTPIASDMKHDNKSAYYNKGVYACVGVIKFLLFVALIDQMRIDKVNIIHDHRRCSDKKGTFSSQLDVLIAM